MEDQSEAERNEGWTVNFISIACACDWIISGNPHARICIIGSESAYRGSFDETYAVAKHAMHMYVEGRKLKSPTQQLVAISPGIIGDCGMTTRRRDVANVARRRREHPKGRFLMARDVARMAQVLLYGDGMDYVSGTVVRMHGGEK